MKCQRCGGEMRVICLEDSRGRVFRVEVDDPDKEGGPFDIGLDAEQMKSLAAALGKVSL